MKLGHIGRTSMLAGALVAQTACVHTPQKDSVESISSEDIATLISEKDDNILVIISEDNKVYEIDINNVEGSCSKYGSEKTQCIGLSNTAEIEGV